MIPTRFVMILAGMGLIALSGASITRAADIGEAESLYEDHCLQCHDTAIYTRTDRKVTSFEGLERQVQRCELALGLRWFDEDISAVTAYLNQHFYHFPR